MVKAGRLQSAVSAGLAVAFALAAGLPMDGRSTESTFSSEAFLPSSRYGFPLLFWTYGRLAVSSAFRCVSVSLFNVSFKTISVSRLFSAINGVLLSYCGKDSFP